MAAPLSWREERGPALPRGNSMVRDEATVIACACTREGKVAVLQAQRALLWEHSPAPSRTALGVSPLGANRNAPAAPSASTDGGWRLVATLVGQSGDVFSALALLPGSLPLEPGLAEAPPMLVAVGTLVSTAYNEAGPGAAVFRIDFGDSLAQPRFSPLLPCVPAQKPPPTRKATKRLACPSPIVAAMIAPTHSLLDRLAPQLPNAPSAALYLAAGAVDGLVRLWNLTPSLAPTGAESHSDVRLLSPPWADDCERASSQASGEGEVQPSPAAGGTHAGKQTASAADDGSGSTPVLDVSMLCGAERLNNLLVVSYIFGAVIYQLPQGGARRRAAPSLPSLARSFCFGHLTPRPPNAPSSSRPFLPAFLQLSPSLPALGAP